MNHRIYAKRGEESNAAKLTDEDIIQIRELIEIREQYKKKAKALSAKNLAEKFDVHYRTIERITQFESWIHVK